VGEYTISGISVTAEYSGIYVIPDYITTLVPQQEIPIPVIITANEDFTSDFVITGTISGVSYSTSIPAVFGTVEARPTPTYYVDINNGDNGNPGTAELPFRTLSGVLSIIQPGDIIQIASGIYEETIRGEDFDWCNANGWPTTYEDRICFWAAPGHDVIVNNPVNDLRSTIAFLSTTYAERYVEFRNIRSTGGYLSSGTATRAAGFSGGATHIYFYDCEFAHNAGTYETGDSLVSVSTSGIEFYNCKFHDCPYTHAVYISTHDNGGYPGGTTPRQSHNVLFYDCEVYNAAKFGLHFNNEDWVNTASGMQVIRCNLHDNGLGGMDLAFGIDTKIISTKFVSNSGYGLWIGYKDSTNTQVINCTMADNDIGLRIGTYISGLVDGSWQNNANTWVKYPKIYNTLFAGNTYNFSLRSSLGIYYQSLASGLVGAEMWNCADDGGSYRIPVGTSGVYNCYSGINTSLTASGYTFLPTSVLREAGKKLSASLGVTEDFYGYPIDPADKAAIGHVHYPEFSYVDLAAPPLQFAWSGTSLGVKSIEDNEYLYQDLGGIQGLEGPQGPTGKSIEYLIYGDQIGLKQEGADFYTWTPSLTGPTGETGPAGTNGINGSPGISPLVIKNEAATGTSTFYKLANGSYNQTAYQFYTYLYSGTTAVVRTQWELRQTSDQVYVHSTGVYSYNPSFSVLTTSFVPNGAGGGTATSIFMPGYIVGTHEVGLVKYGVSGAIGATGPAGLTGPMGATGSGLMYDWAGTSLGVKTYDEVTYEYVDLQGPALEEVAGDLEFTTAGSGIILLSDDGLKRFRISMINVSGVYTLAQTEI
jgi:hypothetical protein